VPSSRWAAAAAAAQQQALGMGHPLQRQDSNHHPFAQHDTHCMP
jgi:hypothetical protein